MVWFKVDDGFATSQKVLSIPIRRRASAIGVWLLAGTWSARHLTDGFVPHSALDEIPDARRRLPDLVSAFLWEVVSNGIQFHDWHDYQPARAEVLQDRASNAARQKAYQDRKRAEREAARSTVTNSVTNGATNNPPTRPDPTRPDRSSYGTTRSTQKPARKRASATTESTATKRVRAAAAALDTIVEARTNGHPLQLGE